MVESAISQGFRVNPHLRPKSSSKPVLRQLHHTRRVEQIRSHRATLREVFDEVKEYSIEGRDLNPENIRLRLIEVRTGSTEARIYFWWNLVWWSIPYEQPIGRQIRFLLWDDGHNAPFGLLGLQSPPLNMEARDRFLKLAPSDLDYWVNQSLSAHRIGALPPYNALLGSKMVALTASCRELRQIYARKYKDTRTVLRKRHLPAKLLFVTTTSAYGKSSVYDRLTYNGQEVCTYLGLTKGEGTFQITDKLYESLLTFLKTKGTPIERKGFKKGTSRKLRLVDKALDILGLDLLHHGIQRGVYLFPHAENLAGVVGFNKRPLWRNWTFAELFRFWHRRWAIPRSKRDQQWQTFVSTRFFKKASRLLK
jgi:hypothetical protein